MDFEIGVGKTKFSSYFLSSKERKVTLKRKYFQILFERNFMLYFFIDRIEFIFDTYEWLFQRNQH